MKRLDLIAVALFGAAAFAAPSFADGEPLGEETALRAVADADAPPALLPTPVLAVGPDGEPSGEPLNAASEAIAAEVAAPWEGPVLLAFLDAPPTRFESETLDRLARWYPVEIVRADRSTRARADALLWRVERFPTFVVADFSPRDSREVDRWSSFIEIERRTARAFAAVGYRKPTKPLPPPPRGRLLPAPPRPIPRPAPPPKPEPAPPRVAPRPAPVPAPPPPPKPRWYDVFRWFD